MVKTLRQEGVEDRRSQAGLRHEKPGTGGPERGRSTTERSRTGNRGDVSKEVSDVTGSAGMPGQRGTPAVGTGMVGEPVKRVRQRRDVRGPHQEGR